MSGVPASIDWRALAHETGLRATAAAAFIVVGPIVALGALALFSDDGGQTARIAQTKLGVYLIDTAIVCAGVGLIAAVVGAGAAWLVTRYHFPGRQIFDWALIIPLAAPGYVLAYAYADLTGPGGTLSSVPHISGAPGAAFVLGLSLYPYVYLVTRRAFADRIAGLMDAAASLGRTPRQAFVEVALPLARPAVAAGAALAMIEAAADYGAASHLGAQTLTTGIMRAWTGAGEPAAAARLACALLGLCAVLMLVELSTRGRGRRAAPPRAARRLERIGLNGWRGWVAAAACASPILLGFALPALHLARLAVGAPLTDLIEPAWRTASLAAVAAGLAATVGLGLALGARAARPSARVGLAVAALGYAAPGPVSALGALALLGAAQAGLDAAFGTRAAPLVAAGGLAVLLLAYQTRFAAAAIGPCATAVARTPIVFDEAARTLGAPPAEVFARVQWPLSRTGVIAAALLVFVEVAKELPATLALRPFDFDTLAVVAHNYAADERLAQAAGPALALALLATPAVIIAARALKKLESGRE